MWLNSESVQSVSIYLWLSSCNITAWQASSSSAGERIPHIVWGRNFITVIYDHFVIGCGPEQQQ